MEPQAALDAPRFHIAGANAASGPACVLHSECARCPAGPLEQGVGDLIYIIVVAPLACDLLSQGWNKLFGVCMLSVLQLEYYVPEGWHGCAAVRLALGQCHGTSLDMVCSIDTGCGCG